MCVINIVCRPVDGAAYCCNKAVWSAELSVVVQSVSEQESFPPVLDLDGAVQIWSMWSGGCRICSGSTAIFCQAQF